MVPAFSLFDEAVHLIHQRWENREGLAMAIAETVKALFGAPRVFVGSTDIKAGLWQPVLNNLLAELDPRSVRSLQRKIESCSALFLSDEKVPASEVLQLPQSWEHGNPYTVISQSFTFGSKVGALIPVWQSGILVDIFADLCDAEHSVTVKDVFDRLIPHLEIACSRAWAQKQMPSLGWTVKRLQDSGLTPRESEVVTWVFQGKTNPEIAAITGTSLQTIKNHLGNAYKKLRVENRNALFALLIGDS